MHFKSRTIVFALKIKTLDLFRTNANFTLCCFLSESSSEWRGKTHPSERQLCCPSPLTQKIRSTARASVSTGMPAIWLLSVYSACGGGAYHHTSSWTRTLFNLARCQMKLAYMFGLLSETSKSHLFWRSLRLSSLQYRMTGLCICTCLPPCGWGFAKFMWTKSSTIVRDDCKFVPWRHLDLRLSVQLFNIY